MYGHNVRMIQLSRGLCFPQKPFPLLRGVSRVLDQLERHDPVDTALPGLVDDAHAAAANFFQEFVLTDEFDAVCRRRSG